MQNKNPDSKPRTSASSKSQTNENQGIDDYDIVVKRKVTRKKSVTPPDQQTELSETSNYNYFTEKDVSSILKNLDKLRNDVCPRPISQDESIDDLSLIHI